MSSSIFTFRTNSKHSPGLYTPHINIPPNFRRCPPLPDNADITQSQAASDDRLLSHVTLGRECRK